MDIQLLSNALIKRAGYSQAQVTAVLGDIESLEPQLMEMLECWTTDQNYNEDFETNGISIRDLQNYMEMCYPAAILTIDWIMKEPEKALPFVNSLIGNRN